MKTLMRKLSDLLWYIRFTFEDGARDRNFWNNDSYSSDASRFTKESPNHILDIQYQSMSCNVFHHKE